MTLRSCLALSVAVLLVPVAPSAEAQGKVDCANAVANSDLVLCAEKELAAADAALNAVYRKALAKIAASSGEKPFDPKSWEAALRASQRAWLAFRDADCKGLVPMAWAGGSGAAGEVLGCLTEMTEARTRELTARFELE